MGLVMQSRLARAGCTVGSTLACTKDPAQNTKHYLSFLVRRDREPQVGMGAWEWAVWCAARTLNGMGQTLEEVGPKRCKPFGDLKQCEGTSGSSTWGQQFSPWVSGPVWETLLRQGLTHCSVLTILACQLWAQKQ